MIKTIQHISYILFAFVFFGIKSSAQVNDTVNYPNNYKAEKDVTYAIVGDWEGKLDVYFPKTNKKLVPLVINIHGGGWNHGTKESQTGFGSFFKNGFAVANIEYRLLHQGEAPSAIEDVRCALLYLVRHAQKYNIDPNKIVIMGGSAGGHLALMSGLLEYNSTFDKNCVKADNFKVVAIINKYGITDLTSSGLYEGKMVQNWLGKNKVDLSFVASVSPINYISKYSPAIFIVHGNSDKIVPYTQSVMLYEKLIKFNIKTEFLTIEDGGHGKFSKEQNKKFSDALWKFLKEIDL